MKKVQPLNGTDVYVEGQSNDANFAITFYEYYLPSECYNLNGMLRKVTDPSSKTITYTYDQYGNVKTSKDGENKITTFNYNNIGWKTSEISPKSYTTVYDYDTNGLLVRSKLHGGETTRITYDYMGRKTKSVSPEQYNSTLDGLNSTPKTYDYSGDHGYRYVYYDNGNLNKVIDPENGTTEYTYDLYGNKQTEKKSNGAVYVFYYDELNRIKKIEFKENVSATPIILEEYVYTILSDGRTQQTHSVYLNDAEKADTITTYDFAGRLLNQINPDNTTKTISYYKNGKILSTTNENVDTTYYKYDGMNRLSETWTPFEKVSGITKYSYVKIDYYKNDWKYQEKISREKVNKDVVPTSFITKTYDYYNNGKLKSETYNDGRNTAYQYDDDGYVTFKDSYTNSSSYIREEYVNNYLGKPDTKKLYSRNGDIYPNTYTDNSIKYIITSYTYNKNGQVKTITNPEMLVTTYGYDNMNRQTSISQPGVDEYGSPRTITTTQQYNWEGKILNSTDENGNVTEYQYNQRGLLEKAIKKSVTVGESKVDLVTAYYYDRAGRKTDDVSPLNYIEGATLVSMNRTSLY